MWKGLLITYSAIDYRLGSSKSCIKTFRKISLIKYSLWRKGSSAWTTSSNNEYILTMGQPYADMKASKMFIQRLNIFQCISWLISEN